MFVATERLASDLKRNIKSALFILFYLFYLIILPHHKYNENNKKIERIALTMARRPKGNCEAYIN